jgi:PAS domain S-box-containing protein
MAKVSQNKVFDLEYFFEIAPDLICIAGFDGYFKKVNPAVSKTLGYSMEELFSRPISSFIHPEDHEVTIRRLSALSEGQSLTNFENRYVAANGSIVWLSWTSIPIMQDQLIFAIAKNVTYIKQLEEYDRISSILVMINDDHQERFRKNEKRFVSPMQLNNTVEHVQRKMDEPSQSDQLWLTGFEQVVRTNVGKTEMNLRLISGQLALSQRQLFRRVDQLLGITPNKLVRVIRLQMSWEAIASGKYRTIKEVSAVAGYASRSHFSRLFKEVYGINVSDLL